MWINRLKCFFGEIHKKIFDVVIAMGKAINGYIDDFLNDLFRKKNMRNCFRSLNLLYVSKSSGSIS